MLENHLLAYTSEASRMFLAFALVEKLMMIHKKRTTQIREHFLEAISLPIAFPNLYL
jgi:hypothetical protein